MDTNITSIYQLISLIGINSKFLELPLFLASILCRDMYAGLLFIHTSYIYLFLGIVFTLSYYSN